MPVASFFPRNSEFSYDGSFKIVCFYIPILYGAQ